MKKILVATDFSENANAVLDFGVDFAKAFNLEIVLFHFYNIPIQTEYQIGIEDYGFYKELKESELNNLKQKYVNSGVNLQTVCSLGLSLHHELKEVIEINQIDLVLIGLKGMSLFDQIVIGSSALSVISNCEIPTLALPKTAKFDNKMQLAFAYDGLDLNAPNSARFLKELIYSFNSKMKAFHVNKEVKDLELYNKLKSYFPQDIFSFETFIEEDVDNGILEFCSNEKIDILTIIHRKHSFYHKLFNRSHTEELAKTGLFSLLVLPEN